MQLSNASLSLSQGSIARIRVLGGRDEDLQRSIDTAVLETAALLQVAGPGVGWALRAIESGPSKGSFSTVGEVSEWSGRLVKIEELARAGLPGEEDLPVTTRSALGMIRANTLGTSRRRELEELALQSAREGDWDSFVFLVVEELEGYQVERVIGVGALAFLEAGDLPRARFLAEMSLGVFDAAAREYEILSTQLRTGVPVDHLVEQVGSVAATILNRDGRLRYLGDVMFLFHREGHQVAAIQIEVLLREELEARGASAPGVDGRSGLSLLDLTSRGVQSGLEPEALEFYRSIGLEASRRDGISARLLAEAVQYRRLPLSIAGVETLFRDLMPISVDASGRDTSKARFDRMCLVARVKAFLGLSYSDELDLAYELAVRCPWAHSKFVSSTRASAIAEVSDLRRSLEVGAA